MAEGNANGEQKLDDILVGMGVASEVQEYLIDEQIGSFQDVIDGLAFGIEDLQSRLVRGGLTDEQSSALIKIAQKYSSVNKSSAPTVPSSANSGCQPEDATSSIDLDDVGMHAGAARANAK